MNFSVKTFLYIQSIITKKKKKKIMNVSIKIISCSHSQEITTKCGTQIHTDEHLVMH